MVKISVDAVLPTWQKVGMANHINTHPPTFYKTLEPEGENFSPEENADRRQFNISQLYLYREACMAEARTEMEWLPVVIESKVPDADT